MSKAYDEYSKLRKVAQERIKRLGLAGADVSGISFPTVKELQRDSIKASKAEKKVRQFLAGPTTVKEWRKTPADLFPSFRNTPSGVETASRSVLLHRERNRRYRERQKEIFSQLTANQQGLLKSARKLGVNISPGQAELFEEYVKYRYAQGQGNLKYWIKRALDDFEDYRKKNPHHSAKEILDDFNRYASERKYLIKMFDRMSKGKDPTARQSDLFNKAWSRFASKKVKGK